MLRFLLLVSVCLSALFTLVGAILSREWGWSEYASDELYVVHRSLTPQQPYPFFAVNADGSGQQWNLESETGVLTTVSCSPDGRTFAFLIDTSHLYVVNESGIEYERVLEQGYDALDTTNSGTVAISNATEGIGVIFNTDGDSLPFQPDYSAYNMVKVASSGELLWSNTSQGGIKALAPTGETILELSEAEGANFAEWITTEQMFSFSYWDKSFYSGAIADGLSRKVVRLHNGITSYGVFSPDARLQALAGYDSNHKPQLFIVDAISGQRQYQLTYDIGAYQTPVCFLTFRPEMLIDQSS